MMGPTTAAAGLAPAGTLPYLLVLFLFVLAFVGGIITALIFVTEPAAQRTGASRETAMLVDVTLTVHGLAIGLVEINPFARRAIAVWGVLGLYGLKASALGVGAVCRLVIPDRYGPIVPFGLALPSFLAVVANAITIGFVTL